MNGRERAIKEFLEYHNLRLPNKLREDSDGLYTLIQIKQAISIGLKSGVNKLVDRREPTWAITLSMLDRVYEHLEGAFISFFTGAWASVEIICRVALEAAINVIYVLESDTPNRISQYFSNYFEEVGKSINKYEQVHSETLDDANQQKRFADDAHNYLDIRRKYIEALFRLEGLPWGVHGWPKQVVERFKGTGLEHEYRSIYAILSSQVHNDADALIDYIIITTLREQIDRTNEMATREMLFWLRLFIYSACDFYAVAASSYTEHYGLTESTRLVLSCKRDLEARLQQINIDFTGFSAAPNTDIDPTR